MRRRDHGSKPRVVVVAEAFPMRGGIATFAETLVEDELLGEQFDMMLLNTARTADREGNRLVLANVGYALDSAWRTFLASRDADLVHLQLVADPGLSMVRTAATCLAAKLGGAVVVAHSHSAIGNAARPDVKAYGRRDRLLLRVLDLTDAVFTVSEPGAELLRSLLRRTPVRAMDNAVDVDAFTTAERTGEDGADGPGVLFVGVFCARKGVGELGRAAAVLRRRGLRFRLVVVGGQGPTPQHEFDRLRKEFDELGLADCLVGPEYGEQVKDRLAGCDVFVLPSFLEGQPISILEAMAAGVPVVGSRVGAVPDTVRQAVDGYVVEPGDVEGLAEALEKLVTDVPARRAMGRSAAAVAKERFDLRALSSRIAAAYTAVLSPTGSPPPAVPPTAATRAVVPGARVGHTELMGEENR